MDPHQSRRPPIFAPPRQNRFETKCKHCKKQQNPQLLQWHETQCQQQQQGALTQIVNVGTQLIRGLSQGMQRNVQKLGNAISNEINQIERIFTNQTNPVPIEIYQRQFNQLHQEGINRQNVDQPRNEPNLIEYNFIDKRNLTPSAKICCICQDEYVQNEKIVLLQCMHRYHKQCLNDWIKKKQTCPILFAQDNVNGDTNQDDPLDNINKLEEQESDITNSTQNSNQQENSNQGTNTEQKEEEIESINRDELVEIIEDAEETMFDLLEALKPLFGLRFGDQDRDENGQVIDDPTEIDDKQEQSNIQKDQAEDVIINVQSDPLMFQWDQLMNDFDPEDLLTFELQSGATEVLCETIKKPTTIRGAYFIPQFRQDQKIDFYIKTSNNTLIYSKERIQEGIFKIDVPEKGEYKFIFTNKRTKEPLTITFAIDVHDSHQEFLKLSDLDPLTLRIERLFTAMRDNYFYDKMAAQQFEGGLKEVQNANNKLLLFSLIEVIGIIAITGWQVFYLKRILSNQRII